MVDFKLTAPEPTEGFEHGAQIDSERTSFIASNKELDDSKVAPATDIVPTVLDHLGIEGGEFDGKSLLGFHFPNR